MKNIFIILFLIISVKVVAQETNNVDVPKGVVYKYCDSTTFNKAKELVTKELTGTPDYVLNDKILFVGPVLWARFQKVKTLKNIEGGNVTLLVDDKKLSGKMTQNLTDSKKVWDVFRNEIANKEFKLRKANYDELRYYWSVISFDIEEPLIIVETKDHNYILDISKKDMKIIWIDEAPKK